MLTEDDLKLLVVPYRTNKFLPATKPVGHGKESVVLPDVGIGGLLLLTPPLHTFLEGESNTKRFLQKRFNRKKIKGDASKTLLRPKRDASGTIICPKSCQQEQNFSFPTMFYPIKVSHV